MNAKSIEADKGENDRLRRQLIAQEKMATMGLLAAGIAHEIRNPLNFVNNFAQLSLPIFKECQTLLDRDADAWDARTLQALRDNFKDLAHNAELIVEHGERAAHIVSSVMRLARNERGRLQPTEFNTLTDEFATIAFHGMRARGLGRGVRIRKHFADHIGTTLAVRANLGRVIINLVNNAMESCVEEARQRPAGYQGEVTVTTFRENGHLAIEVRDNGTGIDATDLATIFDPFFTTKTGESGNLGLGLPICREIVEKEHGGRLDVAQKDGFTSFTIRIPERRPENE